MYIDYASQNDRERWNVYSNRMYINHENYFSDVVSCIEEISSDKGNIRGERDDTPRF